MARRLTYKTGRACKAVYATRNGPSPCGNDCKRGSEYCKRHAVK